MAGSVAEELAAAQGSSQVLGRAALYVCIWILGRRQGCGASSTSWHAVAVCSHSTPFPSHRSPPPPPLQTVLEGDLVSLGVTGPAAALALGLMHLQTNDAGVAAAFHLPGEAPEGPEGWSCGWSCGPGAPPMATMQGRGPASAAGPPAHHTLPSLPTHHLPPDTHFGLDFVHPEQLCLRTLMRALVLWDSIEPSEAWVQAQLPPLLKVRVQRGHSCSPSPAAGRQQGSHQKTKNGDDSPNNNRTA